jgi:hypothetical protein
VTHRRTGPFGYLQGITSYRYHISTGCCFACSRRGSRFHAAMKVCVYPNTSQAGSCRIDGQTTCGSETIPVRTFTQSSASIEHLTISKTRKDCLSQHQLQKTNQTGPPKHTKEHKQQKATSDDERVLHFVLHIIQPASCFRFVGISQKGTFVSSSSSFNLSFSLHPFPMYASP